MLHAKWILDEVKVEALLAFFRCQYTTHVAMADGSNGNAPQQRSGQKQSDAADRAMKTLMRGMSPNDTERERRIRHHASVSFLYGIASGATAAAVCASAFTLAKCDLLPHPNVAYPFLRDIFCDGARLCVVMNLKHTSFPAGVACYRRMSSAHRRAFIEKRIPQRLPTTLVGFACFWFVAEQQMLKLTNPQVHNATEPLTA